MSRWGESVERRIVAPVEQLYALVADPVWHKDFDGSGALVPPVEIGTAERPLGVGDRFGMKMDFRGKYTMTSTVVEAGSDRRFAWQSRPHVDSSQWRFAFGGRIWRYEFEADGDVTLVRESWHLSEEPLRPLMILFLSEVRKNMRLSLDMMAALVGST